MRYIGINNLYYTYEAFGALMGHYASMYSISLDTNIVPVIPKFTNKFKANSAMEFYSQPEFAQDHFDAFKNFNTVFQHINESDYNKIDWKILNFSGIKYDKIINFIKKNPMININCYWSLQSELFWKHIDQIKNYLFVFNDNIISSTRPLLPKTEKSIVALCIRNECQFAKKNCSNYPHTRLSLNYYINAMNQFDKESHKFLIFSDNINQSKKILQDLSNSYDIEYTSLMPIPNGLCLMSMCNHIINANSSFCYWASILNTHPNKKIVCPTQFINPSLDYNLAQSINYKWYPADWVALDIT